MTTIIHVKNQGLYADTKNVALAPNMNSFTKTDSKIHHYPELEVVVGITGVNYPSKVINALTRLFLQAIDEHGYSISQDNEMYSNLYLHSQLATIILHHYGRQETYVLNHNWNTSFAEIENITTNHYYSTGSGSIIANNLLRRTGNITLALKRTLEYDPGSDYPVDLFDYQTKSISRLYKDQL